MAKRYRMLDRCLRRGDEQTRGVLAGRRGRRDGGEVAPGESVPAFSYRAGWRRQSAASFFALALSCAGRRAAAVGGVEAQRGRATAGERASPRGMRPLGRRDCRRCLALLRRRRRSSPSSPRRPPHRGRRSVAPPPACPPRTRDRYSLSSAVHCVLRPRLHATLHTLMPPSSPAPCECVPG